MLTPKTKRFLLQILPYGIIWAASSLTYSIIEKGLLGDTEIYPSTGNHYDFTNNLLVTFPAAFVMGLLIGAAEVRYLSKLFNHLSFSKKIFFKTLIYFIAMITFLLTTSFITNAIDLDKNIFAPEVKETIWNFFSTFAFWSIQIFIALIIGISLLYSEINDNLGQGVLYNFFTGKYHRPVEEERIFMFCDMRSSTTIAEQIGHLQFFELLKTYYSDLSDPIVDYEGEIYQYVGDEIIVSWTLKNGLRNDNFIKCYFAIKEVLQNQAKKYQDNYGLVPSFKSGFHYGKVTTGEIGEVKQDIMFTGDVLNTTARLQGLCNEYNVNILLSGQLAELAELRDRYSVKSLGEASLRGRDEKVTLFTVQ